MGLTQSGSSFGLSLGAQERTRSGNLGEDPPVFSPSNSLAETQDTECGQDSRISKAREGQRSKPVSLVLSWSGHPLKQRDLCVHVFLSVLWGKSKLKESRRVGLEQRPAWSTVELWLHHRTVPHPGNQLATLSPIDILERLMVGRLCNILDEGVPVSQGSFWGICEDIFFFCSSLMVSVGVGHTNSVRKGAPKKSPKSHDEFFKGHLGMKSTRVLPITSQTRAGTPT